MASESQEHGDLFDHDFSKSEKKKKPARKQKKAPNTTGAFRVIHSADWHLGKMLGDLSRDEEHDRFLAFLLQTIEAEKVDALIVAGDIFDSANPPQSALRRYYQFLSSLHATTDCSVVIIAGNHDSPALVEAPREVLGNLRTHVVGALPDDPSKVLIPLPNEENVRLVVAAVPFLRDRDVRMGKSGQSATDIRRDLTEGIRSRYAEVADAAARFDAPLIATGHLTVSGSALSDSEREIHIGGLGKVEASIFPETFDYVALGHLHRPQSADKNERVCYSGSPIPLSFSEAEDRKEIRLIEFSEAGKLVTNRPIFIPPTRKLIQLHTSREELDEALRTLKSPEMAFETWVEVVVNNAASGENLVERVRELVSEDAGYQVVRVMGSRESIHPTLSEIEDEIDDEWGSGLLDRVDEVFRIRLDQEEELTEEEREAVKVTFLELVEMHDEQRREASEAS